MKKIDGVVMRNKRFYEDQKREKRRRYDGKITYRK
jgi:hypothetical protein